LIDKTPFPSGWIADEAAKVWFGFLLAFAVRVMTGSIGSAQRCLGNEVDRAFCGRFLRRGRLSGLA